MPKSPKTPERKRVVRTRAHSGDFADAMHITGRMPIIDAITTILDGNRRGRKRALPWRALFVAMYLAGAGDATEEHCTRMHAALCALTPSQRHALDVRHVVFGYSQIESGMQTLEDEIGRPIVRDSKTGKPKVVDGKVVRRDGKLFENNINEQTIANAWIAASLPDNLPSSPTVAIDSTDHETWAARRSRTTLVEVEETLDDLETSPECEDGPAEHFVTQRGTGRRFPYTDPRDDRLRHSLDADATDGYRSGKRMERKNVFVGYDIHLSADVARHGGALLPGLVRSMFVAPAGSHKGEAGLQLLRHAEANTRTEITDVVCDRGYSMAAADRWARPLIEMGIVQHHDLGRNETRLQPSEYAGVIILDGRPTVASLPKRHKDLRRPGLGAKGEEVAASLAAYDERSAYVFKPLGKPNKSGAQRYQGPASYRIRQLRCVNWPESMRFSDSLPVSKCMPDQKCHCGATITIKVSDQSVKHRQPTEYGTSKWFESYGPRSIIESVNSSLKGQHANLDRDSIQMFGIVKNTILLGAIIAAMNASIIRSAYGVDLANPSTFPSEGEVLTPIADRNYKNTGRGAPTGTSEPPDPPPDASPLARDQA